MDDILHYITDHDVDVVDMFRLGRFIGNNVGAPHKPTCRPILVKLRAFWDRRVILSKSRVLKRYDQPGIFNVPEELVEVRRKNTLDTLQSRALHEGKQTVVVDGVLFIDDVVVFSLQTGYLHSVSHG